MTAPTLAVHDGGRTITGSCFQLSLGGAELLVDCGLFQGTRTVEALNRSRG